MKTPFNILKNWCEENIKWLDQLPNLYQRVYRKSIDVYGIFRKKSGKHFRWFGNKSILGGRTVQSHKATLV